MQKKVPLKNRLFTALPLQDAALLKSKLKTVELKLHQVLLEPQQPVTHLYFPVDAIISIISQTKEGETVETGMIGNEGVAGAAALLGRAMVPYLMMVQCGGKAQQIPFSFMQDFFSKNIAFRSLILRYLQNVLLQVAQSVICNRFHKVKVRIARWLLSTQDRRKNGLCPYTHEFLAMMLGTRRVSITLALGAMEKAGMIQMNRGAIKIKDRKKIEALACECYFIAKQDVDAMFLPQFVR